MRPSGAASLIKALLPGGLAFPAALILALALTACHKSEPEPQKPEPTSSLTIFALQHIRSSGFEGVVLKDFAANNKTALEVVIFPDLPSLLDSLSVSDSLANADIVLGLDNSFALADTILEPFEALPELSLARISHEVPRDPDQRLIPYATANLAFIYDSRKFPDPPKSFGELQDDRYLNQLALCDPATSGLGRGSLLWTIALFGDPGYEQLWGSLRKNVRKLYTDHSECLSAIRRGDCGLMIGYNSVPAWIGEFYPSESHIQAVIPEEGSFRHTEYAALCAGAPNRAAALKFLERLISAEAQQFVMYKLAMMPVNGRTILSRGFARVPWSVYTVNDRLNRYEVKQNLPLWLQNWDRLVNGLPLL